DRLAAGAHLARHRGIAWEVQPFLDSQHRRQRHDVDVTPAVDLLLAPHGGALEGDLLETCDARPAEPVRDANPDLEAARVGGLIVKPRCGVVIARASSVNRMRPPVIGTRLMQAAIRTPYARMRVFSGSNRGVAPATATLTGYRSPMYSTRS